MSDRRVLFSFAHPDDESFTGAGVTRMSADAGVELTLVTATRGQAGKCGDPPVCAPEEISATRERELRAAVDILGIQRLYLLDYEDRQLADAEPGKIRAELVDLLRRHRPHIVVTFDPNGLTGHPDHKAISRFTSDAIQAAADPRLRTDAAPHQVTRLLWTPSLPPWEFGRRADLADQPGIDFVIDVSAWREQKRAALAAHRTQHLAVDRYWFDKPDVDRLLSVEAFRQAWGPALSERPMREFPIDAPTK
ncbi:MAG: PIG-L deacetylase family protein [Vicinamibacterales bacterium]|jgi:LmbE family N-acetylglucosaminyl deacetylase|nr:PIG-L domain-containing protein [Acidobacteriota bacterium]MDP7294416.1 PIG-L deacetylase family protein [Vicinamibacterales bacterium]MDP7471730.1 PIG-L deacetylase family protein [Vicinamibacterales bacterium]MDP7672358.1 PIG-L deacetylase family protein [Vicinamibacterales bacterium]HJO37947.1 PIG-L deacetylase family protein [Vicinamibacterales bacterium]|tara:strand:- start:4346 stop:5095 length:750 start_codon:yes stop_codon:yes gene_type:complete